MSFARRPKANRILSRREIRQRELTRSIDVRSRDLWCVEQFRTCAGFCCDNMSLQKGIASIVNNSPRNCTSVYRYRKCGEHYRKQGCILHGSAQLTSKGHTFTSHCWLPSCSTGPSTLMICSWMTKDVTTH